MAASETDIPLSFLPWLGFAGILLNDSFALVVPLLLLIRDVSRSIKRSTHWIPGRSFVLGALTLELIGNLCRPVVTISDVRKLNPELVAELSQMIHDNQISILAGRVVMCVFIGILLPEVPRSCKSERWSDIAALSISVGTMLIHISYEIYVVVLDNWISYHGSQWDNRTIWLLVSNIIIFCSIVLVLLLLYCAALASNSIQDVVDHKIPVLLSPVARDDSELEYRLERAGEKLVLSWITAQTYQPQYIIARSVLIASTGFLVTLCVVIFIAVLTSSGFMAGYKSSILQTLYFPEQLVFILIGWAIVFWRWVTAIFYYPRRMRKGASDFSEYFRVEDFWTRATLELREEFRQWDAESMENLTFLKRSMYRLVHKSRLYKLLCILFRLQILLIRISKICWLISEIIFCNCCTQRLFIGRPENPDGRGVRGPANPDDHGVRGTASSEDPRLRGPANPDNSGVGGPVNPDNPGVRGPENPYDPEVRGPANPDDPGVRGPASPEDPRLRGHANLDPGARGPASPEDTGLPGPANPDHSEVGGPANPDEPGVRGPENPDDPEVGGSGNPDAPAVRGPASPEDPGLRGPSNPNDPGVGGPANPDDPGVRGPENSDDPEVGGSANPHDPGVGRPGNHDDPGVGVSPIPSDFEKYSQVLMHMSGENLTAVWVANIRSIKKMKDEQQNGKSSGIGCGTLISLLEKRSRQGVESTDVFAIPSTRILQLERDFHLQKCSAKMKVVSLLTIMIELSKLQEIHRGSLDPPAAEECIKGCSEAWKIIEFAEISDPKASLVSRDADSLFQNLQESPSMWLDRKLPVNMSGAITGLQVMTNLQSIAEEKCIKANHALIRTDEYRGYDSSDWKAGIAGNSLYTVCENIKNRSANIQDMLEEIRTSLADVIWECVNKVPAIIVDKCTTWVDASMDLQLSSALYIVGMAQGINQVTNQSPQLQIDIESNR